MISTYRGLFKCVSARPTGVFATICSDVILRSENGESSIMLMATFSRFIEGKEYFINISEE